MKSGSLERNYGGNERRRQWLKLAVKDGRLYVGVPWIRVAVDSGCRRCHMHRVLAGLCAYKHIDIHIFNTTDIN